MKYIVIALALCTSLVAQNKGNTPANTMSSNTPVKPLTSTTTTPIPPKSALAIRDAQVDVLNLQTQLQNAQMRMNQTIKEAYTEAGLKDTEYAIDDKRWVFVSLKPPGQPPAPASPAGAKK